MAEGTKVTFKSGNPDVATVDENGKVVAVKPGNTKITVTAGDQTATCVVACKWEESKPSTGSGSSSSGGGTTTPDPRPSKGGPGGFLHNGYHELLSAPPELG